MRRDSTASSSQARASSFVPRTHFKKSFKPLSSQDSRTVLACVFCHVFSPGRPSPAAAHDPGCVRSLLKLLHSMPHAGGSSDCLLSRVVIWPVPFAPAIFYKQEFGSKADSFGLNYTLAHWNEIHVCYPWARISADPALNFTERT